jgi:excisionase family DNA binding protein
MNAPVTITRADLDAAIADAIAHALKAAGVGAGKAKSSPPRIGYTMKEAASVTGVGRTTLYLAIRRHELRVVKKGARTIILDRDLRRWLEGLPALNA